MTDVNRSVRLDAALGALIDWTVVLVQFNGLVAGRLGVTESDLQCLFVLAHSGPSTAGALAARINLTSGSVSRMIDRLVAAGHVTRTPDPHDRRRVVVAAVPASLAEVARCYEPLTTRIRADLDGFDAGQLDQLARFGRAAEQSTEAEIRRM